LTQSPPKSLESLTLPSDHRLRLNECERSSPILIEFLQRDPKPSISIAQPWSFFIPREDGQLMTKRDVLQGDLLVTTEDEKEESNRQQK
jgi:hypothetical protein